MEYTKKTPTKEGFYWCKPVFSNITMSKADRIETDKPTIAQIIATEDVCMGSNMHIRFIGGRFSHSINSPVIRDTLWGKKVNPS
jgi:hypothetical protein